MGQLLLVRHGQADAEGDDYDRLVDRGWDQGRVLGAFLADRGIAPDALVRGGLRRHEETARAAFPGLEADVDAGWDEFDHLEILRHVGQADDFQSWLEVASDRWTGGQFDADYAETWTQFTGRVTAALHAAAQRRGTTAVVTSGGAIGWVAASLLHPDAAPRQLARLWRRLNDVCVNAGVTRVVSGRRGLTLVSFNEQAHLSGDLITYR